MQARHQRRRRGPKHARPEFRQQFDRGAPALDLLVSGDVSAHGARIGVRRRAGKPLGKAAEGRARAPRDRDGRHVSGGVVKPGRGMRTQMGMWSLTEFSN